MKKEKQIPKCKLCGLLPADINWGDSITPDIVEQIVLAERSACFGALEIVMLMARDENYSGQAEAVQECMFAIQERSKVVHMD